MKHLLIALARTYQLTLSPILQVLGGPGCGCRFEPSCSRYFIEAVQAHGAWRGGFMGLRRLAKCHPWGGFGYDPVPHKHTSLSR